MLTYMQPIPALLLPALVVRYLVVSLTSPNPMQEHASSQLLTARLQQQVTVLTARLQTQSQVTFPFLPLIP